MCPTPLPIACEYFHVEKINVTGEVAGHCDGSSFHVLTCIAGKLNVNVESLSLGAFALLPATLGAYRLTGNGAALRVFVPPRT